MGGIFVQSVISNLCGSEHRRDEMPFTVAFLSYLCGSELIASDDLRFLYFLSYLCGSEPKNYRNES